LDRCGLGLKGRNDWSQFCKGLLPEKGVKPDNIPVEPSRIYKNDGWKNWGDWFGTGVIATYSRKYILFEDAREFVHGLGLKSAGEWFQLCKGLLPEKGVKPDNIPANPQRRYKNDGWKNLGDWLGTGVIATSRREYIPFEDAREFVHGLGLKSAGEWFQFCKGLLPEKGVKPDNIPAIPYKVYKNDVWKNWGDWLGTGAVADQFREFLPFEEARDFVHSLQLKNQNEWTRFCKGLLPEKGVRPDDIPTNPQRAYRNQGWKNCGDWLGTGAVAARLKAYQPFEEAREFARGLQLKSEDEWKKFCKGLIPEKGTLPRDIPMTPRQVYMNKGWKGMGDWLGKK
jgi:hypothetical protein